MSNILKMDENNQYGIATTKPPLPPFPNSCN